MSQHIFGLYVAVQLRSFTEAHDVQGNLIMISDTCLDARFRFGSRIQGRIYDSRGDTLALGRDNVNWTCPKKEFI